MVMDVVGVGGYGGAGVVVVEGGGDSCFRCRCGHLFLRLTSGRSTFSSNDHVLYHI